MQNAKDEQLLGLAPDETSETPTSPRQETVGRILIAEDNNINQFITKKLVESAGYTADVVVNGREATEAIKRQEYALILMDCQMPEMDGYEATIKIREYEANCWRHTLIIALTACAMTGEREKCLQAGMDDYMTKPALKIDLETMLKKWIK